MAKLDRKQAKEMIEAYLAQRPDATIKEIANFVGVSKQRAYISLKLLGMTTQRQGKDYKPETLTEREVKILRRIAKGETNKEIAEALNANEQTVKNYVTLILAKLKANNRAHAVTLAMQQGLVSLDELRVTKTASK